MRGLAGAALSAVANGRFVTPWSVAISLPLSLTVMAPVGYGIEPLAALPAMIATWICFAMALAAVAVIERTMRRTRTRTVIVILGVLLCAAMRPVVQDAWLHLIGLPEPPIDQLPFRMATNVFVWVVVLSIVAVLEESLRSLRRTNTLLRSVVAALSQAQGRAQIFAQEARQLLEEAQSALGITIDDLRPTSAEVRRLGEEDLRAWSHRFAALADASDEGDESDVHALRPDGPATRRSAVRPLTMLRLPPPGIVTVLYAVCLLPYAARTQAPVDVITGSVALLVGGAIVDAVPRRRARARTPRKANRLFLLLSAVVGLALSALAAGQGVAPIIAMVSAIAYLGFAFAAGACTGALHSLRREQHRLSGAISHAQRATRAGTRPTRQALRGTAELLHRDGQGACVVFAMAHAAPTSIEIRKLQHDLTAVVDRMPSAFAAAHRPAGQVSLTGLLNTWANVIDLHTDIDDDSVLALQKTPWIAQDCYDVIAEGLLNVAKHGSERRAEVSLIRVSTGAGPRLRVRVTSIGEAPPGTRLRATSRMHRLGARLIPHPGAVTLEALFPLTADPVVVSAEHRA